MGVSEKNTVCRATLIIGTYTESAQQGICGASFDLESGELGPVRTLAATSNPSFLVASGGCLYAVNEWGRVAGEDVGGLSTFRIDKTSGELSPLSAIAQGGVLCHLMVDATGRWLFVCAYGAGTVSTWQILPDGSIGERVAVVQHHGRGANEARQSGPHAHHVVLSPDNRRAFVADLGLDKVMVYEFDVTTGALTPGFEEAPFATLPGGAGPRHVAFTPSGAFLYAVSELSNTVTAFRVGPRGLQPLQTIGALPTGFAGQSFTAEIAVHPSGRFLYVSNRGHDSLAHYGIEADGQLKLMGFAPTGRAPRHFTFDERGRWLLVANQLDRSIFVFAVEPASGILTWRHQLEDVPGQPTCLLLV